jgi:hypothetical protein
MALETTAGLEPHGTDESVGPADATTDGLWPALARRQLDLRVTLDTKLAAIDRTLTQAQQAGARFVTLAEAAQDLAKP